MLRDEAIAIIQRTLGFRGDKVSDIEKILEQTQDMYEQGEELPFFLRTEISTINTTADEERIPLPDDFLMEWEDDALWYFDASADTADQWTLLAKEGLDFLRASDALAGTGSPEAYAFDGTYFRLFPTPDLIYPIKAIYLGKDAPLTSNIENGWMKHLPYLLIGTAGIQLAVGLREKPEATALFSKWETEGLKRLLVQTISRDMANRKLVMGGED